jgi:hypothetical protein
MAAVMAVEVMFELIQQCQHLLNAFTAPLSIAAALRAYSDFSIKVNTVVKI